MTLTLGHFLSLGAMLFALSVIGIFLNRKNLIVLLMAIELMLLAVNMNFVAFSYYTHTHTHIQIHRYRLSSPPPPSPFHPPLSPSHTSTFSPPPLI